jgi:hypothetical protein
MVRAAMAMGATVVAEGAAEGDASDDDGAGED